MEIETENIDGLEELDNVDTSKNWAKDLDFSKPQEKVLVGTFFDSKDRKKEFLSKDTLCIIKDINPSGKFNPLILIEKDTGEQGWVNCNRTNFNVLLELLGKRPKVDWIDKKISITGKSYKGDSTTSDGVQLIFDVL